ncbi:hypothetical protein LN042_11520 [Kitasatospora sp. RB6PN24]|uniref:hypothetical protein n=1 Tax=Kitasatospora humi TaxID=2893891 RepID=UPI001E4F3E10|nr:hypothetical protein [Kitasatospora humi]MCC9307718.1 hypothetical protein [Kitasatospora humi]
MPPSRAELAAKHQRVRELAAAGRSTAAIARELGMDRRSVREVRATAGIPALPGGTVQHLTVEEKWAERTRPVDGGHLEWTGEHSTGPSRTPVMRHSGQTYTAGRIAYRIQHGTDPTGHAKPDCGHHRCVAPAHQYDTATRQPVYEPRVHYDSIEAKLAALTETTDDGHVRWTGPTTASGQRVLSFGGTNHPAARVAFRAHWGREPIGPVLSACDYPHCLLGAHLDDKQARDAFRAMFTGLFGRAV